MEGLAGCKAQKLQKTPCGFAYSTRNGPQTLPTLPTLLVRLGIKDLRSANPATLATDGT